MKIPLAILAAVAAAACLVRHGRHLRRDEDRRQHDDELDAALADSFPASDPPSMTRPVR